MRAGARGRPIRAAAAAAEAKPAAPWLGQLAPPASRPPELVVAHPAGSGLERDVAWFDVVASWPPELEAAHLAAPSLDPGFIPTLAKVLIAAGRGEAARPAGAAAPWQGGSRPASVRRPGTRGPWHEVPELVPSTDLRGYSSLAELFSAHWQTADDLSAPSDIAFFGVEAQRPGSVVPALRPIGRGSTTQLSSSRAFVSQSSSGRASTAQLLPSHAATSTTRASTMSMSSATRPSLCGSSASAGDIDEEDDGDGVSTIGAVSSRPPSPIRAGVYNGHAPRPVTVPVPKRKLKKLEPIWTAIAQGQTMPAVAREGTVRKIRPIRGYRFDPKAVMPPNEPREEDEGPTEDEKEEYIDWKRKVRLCAYNLQQEVARFRN